MTFLGTGTSEGVPIAGVDFPGLDLKNPKNWRTRSSIHVEMDGHHVQVDAGQEFRLQCLWNGIERIDTFILTHGHSDHVLGMDDLRRHCQDGALTVYSTEEGMQRVREIFFYAIMDKPKVQGYPAFQPALMPEVLEVPGGKIYSTLLPHGAMDVLGLVFVEASSGKKVVYYCDCKTVPESAQELAKGADLVILDGLRPHVHPNHMTVDEAVEMAGIIGGKKSYLTHMTSYVDYATYQQRLPDTIELAYDGLVVHL